MQATFTAVIEQCTATNLYIGYVPGFAGAHSQGASVQELIENLREVCSMLLEDGLPVQESAFVTTEQFVLEA
ncbi:MAG: type II toxin-antitoxin system HicB family antitoxin [Candidatus Kapabacteria bacterium]|jgi:predicted RNase H-like HicB family nuclease|nr:type II toxin-antitoxin system HicB family antitoxin [Candidatus Kapabacteria bacterium]